MWSSCRRIERAAIAALPFDEAAYLAEVGATALVGEPGYSTLERQWTRPTLEINGMWGGYEGPGSKTVTPSEAHAKITCRLVPDQDSADITEKIIRHLETHLPPGVRLAVSPEAHAAQPYRIPADHIGLRMAAAALGADLRRPAARGADGRHRAGLRGVQARDGAGHCLLLLLDR